MSKKVITDDILRAKIFHASQIIEKNLQEPLKVSQLAKKVGLSVSHFHLAFKNIVGEPVMHHILRLRVEYAAYLLKFSSWQAGDIALVSGFYTAASFSRSFKKIMGITPQQYRHKKCKVPFLQGYLRSRPDIPLQNKDVITPTPTARIEEFSKMRAICLRFYGSVNDVYKPWQEILSWAKQNISNLDNARYFGLWFDDWAYTDDDDHYRYECAIFVPDIEQLELPKPFFIRELVTGPIAVAYSKGKIKNLDSTWKSFAYGWLPFSGFQPRGTYVFDEYPAKFMLTSPLQKLSKLVLGQIELNMNIPVQKDPLIC